MPVVGCMQSLCLCEPRRGQCSVCILLAGLACLRVSMFANAEAVSSIVVI